VGNNGHPLQNLLQALQYLFFSQLKAETIRDGSSAPEYSKPRCSLSFRGWTRRRM
jgi:hypothetical protein